MENKEIPTFYEITAIESLIELIGERKSEMPLFLCYNEILRVLNNRQTEGYIKNKIESMESKKREAKR